MIYVKFVWEIFFRGFEVVNNWNDLLGYKGKVKFFSKIDRELEDFR